jgi:replication factor A1
MTTQELIQEILRKNQQTSQEQIMERLVSEKERTGGLFGDETLLRLIAAKLGVQVSQNTFHNKSTLSTSRLFAGLNDVTVEGRLIAVFATKTFQGAEKSGKFATVMISDDDGVLRVLLWNEKADLVERGELKVGQTVRFLHGYTREDRYGKTELHLGGKSQIEIESEAKATQYSSIEKFAQKINTLNPYSGNVLLLGRVKCIIGKTSFARNGSDDGLVMRLTLVDDSGQVTVIVWNEKVAELEGLPENTRVMLINARAKEGQNGNLEVHVDSNTAIKSA